LLLWSKEPEEIVLASFLNAWTTASAKSVARLERGQYCHSINELVFAIFSVTQLFADLRSNTIDIAILLYFVARFTRYVAASAAAT
jgi:hypothetical protein